jgi:hypothetical protein
MEQMEQHEQHEQQDCCSHDYSEQRLFGMEHHGLLQTQIYSIPEEMYESEFLLQITNFKWHDLSILMM